jgi:hypothetical protein
MENKLILLSILIIFACGTNKAVDPSCSLNQYYDEINNECIDFCVDEDEALFFDHSNNEYYCDKCNQDNQYISNNGLCITCNNNQILVNDGNDNYYCKNIEACTYNNDCDASQNLVCNQIYEYCVNCIDDTDCGLARFCKISQFDGTCTLKKTMGAPCFSNNECASNKCNTSLYCSCINDYDCFLYGLKTNTPFNTYECNNEGVCHFN